ncbi:MAG TPA: L-ribulose-5-phosphate 4-epimerase [Candidatus Acidoferrum sp.]|jgi:L-ribulose-5-phosphate 4-epimerase|nr:L-ribulose-5-phosphate 4-epimerase [Candidatus Acidoferrum sp.]
MILRGLREEVLEANLELVRRGLVLYTFGNASGISREEGLVAIKPSGVAYETMKAEDLVVVDLEGNIVEGTLRPSSDLPTHLILYKAFKGIGGIAHTHSSAATAWAQAQKEIPCFGTTHADYFHGPVPVTKPLSPAQIRTEYEANTGHAIVRRFKRLDPLHIPAVLVAGHAPFCWGKSPAEAAHVAVILEEIAAVAFRTIAANPKARPISQHLHDKHFLRKHGSSAYYGQKK